MFVWLPTPRCQVFFPSSPGGARQELPPLGAANTSTWTWRDAWCPVAWASKWSIWLPCNIDIICTSAKILPSFGDKFYDNKEKENVIQRSLLVFGEFRMVRPPIDISQKITEPVYSQIYYEIFRVYKSRTNFIFETSTVLEVDLMQCERLPEGKPFIQTIRKLQ